MSTTLAQLEVGNRAKIEKYTDADVSLKLMQMGCIPGEIITVSNIAPLGDPIAILVSGYQLSLRLSEASKVIVNRLN